MGRIEALISTHRINKAIAKVIPRDYQADIVKSIDALYPAASSNHDAAAEYYKYENSLYRSRRLLKDKIKEEHPEWFKKAPKVRNIVSFLTED